MIRTISRRRGLLMAAFLAATLGTLGLSPTAIATEDPIPLIDVVVKKTPPGNASFPARTDNRGRIVFKFLAPGTYVVTDRKGNDKTFAHPGGRVQWQFFDATTMR